MGIVSFIIWAKEKKRKRKNSFPGFLKAKDLKGYVGPGQEPLLVTIPLPAVHEHPCPAAGPALLSCLQMFCGFWLVPWNPRSLILSLSPFPHRLLPGQTLLPVWGVPWGREAETQPLCYSLQWVSLHGVRQMGRECWV